MYQIGESVSIIPWLTGEPCTFTSNLDVARQVVSGSQKTDFNKGMFGTGPLLLWGMNLFAADGDVWHKHRRVVGPAFNNNLYESVWDRTQATYNEILATDQWSTNEQVALPAIQKITFKLALSVIAVCGFGFSVAWDEPELSEDGSMSVQEALQIVTDNNALAFAPGWVKNPPFK